MQKTKHLMLLMVLAFVSVLPVSAAPIRNQDANAQTSESEEETGGTVRSTREYVQDRVEEMKTLRTEDKAAETERVVARIQERVAAMIQNAIRRYERVQTQVDRAEGLTAEEKAAIKNKITVQIETMNMLKTELDSAETVAELKAVMTQVKSKFKLSLGLVRQAVSGVYDDRLTNVLVKLTDVYTRLYDKVAALGDSQEKTELFALLSETQVLLTEAGKSITAEEFVKARENMVKAHENLKEVAGGLK